MDFTDKLDILYARRSSEDGKDGESIENQVALLKQYAADKGYYKIKVVTDDGYTGTNFNRLGFQEAFALIQYRHIGRFIVMKKTLPLSMIHRKLLSPVKNMKRQRNAESQPNVRFRPKKGICLTI